ncbi:MAG: aminotransferase class I/II-fold pyridoxal phosphate-dependent enzyme [Actinobacteria bacterium]|jgi:cystathionine beta-lyase|uniref:cysteine-S-conjugate beta-lyase n=1 Tax=freshwater metagenome TaxID=449393 RepID=A0A6J6JPL2_9ZZZZ|nr:aminotransferase class I/II-fold pyridoxal phosphate-dependent enzyme [Actinomycetota bacterium]MSZ23137.1 aminotransferase class I/II-fold pyridoxal phosphate-dependent enzyme [Actinomycetota bacterium]MTA92340.1 aminotransferase class I/II-fold pyridoxal phosphate-dependent enzyme [Actinomycetota bacterium]
MEHKYLTDITQVRQRTSAKWRRFPADVLPMHVAEMDYDVAPNIRTRLAKMVADSDLGYTGPVPEVAQGFSEFAESRWGWNVDTKQVRLSTDVGVSAVEILRVICKSGDKVVINSPVYYNFFSWIKEAGANLVDVPLVEAFPQWELDLEALEQSFRDGAKVYLLCSPHNPLGKVYTKQELITISELAAKYNVIVISDEIHAPLTYAGENFVPYLSVSDQAQQTGICITAASKSFNLAGLKASIIVTADANIHEKLNAMPPAMHWRSGLLGAIAMAEAFADGQPWLDSIIELNRKSRDLLRDLLATQAPEVRYWIPQASYLAWLDLGSLNIGATPAAQILEEQKVAFQPGTDLGSQYTKYVRLNFGCHPDSLQRAVKALAAYSRS